MDAPLRDPLNQLLHLPNRCHPTAVHGFLWVDDAAAHIEAHGVTLSDEADLAPLKFIKIKGKK